MLLCFILWTHFQAVGYLCRRPCKVGIRYLEDGTKVRVSRGEGSSGSIIPRPEILKIRTTPRPTVGTSLKTYLFAVTHLTRI
jgi:large subunit ribosomal protein L24